MTEKEEQSGSSHGLSEQGSADFIPGTVRLVDLEGTMQTKHASGSQNDIVLVPAPSSDPDDPLNWAPRRKLLSTTCVCVYTLAVGISSSSVYSVLFPISTVTPLTLNDLNSGTGYMFLFFGLGCLIWQPLAIRYGKRPAYLLSLLASAAFNCWAPHATTNGTWIASRILIGFSGAPIESLCEISMTDVYFTHERGTYIALYGLLLSCSNYFAPLVSGFITDGQGWEWVLYWTALANGTAFVFLFFFMEETNYHRAAALDKAEQVDGGATNLTNKDKTIDSSSSGVNVHETDSSQPQSQKTYLEKLKPISRQYFVDRGPLLRMAWRPIIFFTFPVITFAGFSYGSYLVWFFVLNSTASLIFSNPPYNFNPSHVGLVYISPIIATLCAAVYCGRFGDRFVLRMARKNNGVMEPEHRLWLLSICIFLVPTGLILWGVGTARSVHWFGVVFGMGIISFANMVGLQVSISYAIDSYRHLSGESMVTVMLIRNSMGFAMGYGVTPWVTDMGYQNAFILAACVSILQVLTFLLGIFFGKGRRKASVPRYWRYLKEMSAAGVAH